MEIRTKVIDWKPQGGYGFVVVNGRRAFVHVTDIHGDYFERGADLNGTTLVVYATQEDPKGFRITWAATLEEHEKTLARLAEEARLAEDGRLAKAREVQEVEAYLQSRSVELLEQSHLLFAAGRVEKDFHFRLRKLPLADSDKSLRAELVRADALTLSEEPLCLKADLFVRLSKMKEHDISVAHVVVGPIAHFTLDGWDKWEIGPHEGQPYRFCPNTWQPDMVTWSRERLVAAIEFAAKGIPAPIFFSREFPVQAEAPYREKERVMQRILCTTPCGDVSHTFQLHPNREYSDYPTYMQVWGGYDISALIAEASLFTSEQEVATCLREKFTQERIPSTWEESGGGYTPHEDIGTGLHGGDFTSVTYTNKVFADEVARLYAMDLRKEILVEVARIPAEAQSLGWLFFVKREWPLPSWPTVKVPITIVEGRTDNDFKEYEVPRWVSPVQLPEYRQALDAVLTGATASEAVKSFLEPCPKPHPTERQKVARWLRFCRKDGVRQYGLWRKPPTIQDAKIASHASALFVRMKEKQLLADGLEAEVARQAAQRAAEEKRIVDLAKVRKDWRQVLSWRQRLVQALHEDAQVLLEKIRTAQDRADSIARPRKETLRREEEARRAEELARQKQTEKDQFLGKGAWGGLDKLKL